MADIVDSIFYEVSNHYTEKMFEEFHGFFSHVQSLVSATEKNIINTINYNFEREYLNELSSITEFFEEIYEDIGEISSSKDRCNSYLTHIIGNRQKVLKLIKHFLDNLWNWPGSLLQRDFSNRNYIDINYYALANDYLVYRQAVSNYVICLVFEYILSGNIVEKSKNKIIQKVERILQKFREADNAIKGSLEQRNTSHWQNYQWYTPYENNSKHNDRAGINWFISEYAKNDNFEIDEIVKLFSKSKNLLENIIIE
jgi:hypothetical protein